MSIRYMNSLLTLKNISCQFSCWSSLKQWSLIFLCMADILKVRRHIRKS